MVRNQRVLVCPQDPYTVRTRQPRRLEAAKLYEIAQSAAHPPNCCTARPLIIDKNEPGRFAAFDNDDVRRQVTMDEAGTMEPRDLFPQ